MDATVDRGSPSSNALLHFALLLDGKGGARHLGLDEVRGWKPEQGHLWVHLDPRSREDEAWLREFSGLSPPDLDALHTTKDRARLEITGPESILTILDTSVPPVQGGPRPQQGPVAVWTEPHRILSYGSPPRPAIEESRAALEMGRGAVSVQELLREITQFGLAKVAIQVSVLDDDLSKLEGAMQLDKAVSANQLHDIRRRAVQLRYQTEPLRDVLTLFHAQIPPWLAKEIGYWREFANSAVDHLEQIDSLLHRADVLNDHLEQRTSANTERAIYIITLLSGLFLPLSFLTGLLGMNVGGVPLKDNRLGFFITCAVLLVLALLSYRLFRRKHWV